MKTLLEILQKQEEPMVAAELARMLHLAGGRETQRRKIREIVKELRDDGNWIVATLTEGYWLTHDFNLWNDYLQGRQINAKRIFAEVSRRKERVKMSGQKTFIDLVVK